jgi:hypothetical protein
MDMLARLLPFFPLTLVSRELGRFTARVGGTVDAVKGFDTYMARVVEGLSQDARRREQDAGGIMSRGLSVLRPLAAFSAFDQSTGDRLKRIFLETITNTGERIDGLLTLASVLDDELDGIQEALENIKKVAMGEIGDLPTRDTLRALWNLLALPDDKEYLRRSHEVLLTDLMNIYKAAVEVVRETTAALLHARAELQEFGDAYIDPAMLLRKYPLDVIADRIRGSAQRLGASRKKLDDKRASRYAGAAARTADVVVGGTTYAYGA